MLTYDFIQYIQYPLYIGLLYSAQVHLQGKKHASHQRAKCEKPILKSTSTQVQGPLTMNI
jgi:hypothetical protein